MTIKFSFPQTIPTICPQISDTVEFYGIATWVPEAERFAIDKVSARMPNGEHMPIEIPTGFDAMETYRFQAEDGPLAKFLSRCRIAAMKAATEAGKFDPQRPDLRKPVLQQDISEMS